MSKANEINDFKGLSKPNLSIQERQRDVDDAKSSNKNLNKNLKKVIAGEHWKFEPYGMTKTAFITEHFPDSRATFYRLESELKVKSLLTNYSDDNFPYSSNACQAMSTFNNKYGIGTTLELDNVINTIFGGKPTADLIKTYNKKFATHGELLPLSEYPREKESSSLDKNPSIRFDDPLTDSDIEAIKHKLENSSTSTLDTLQELLKSHLLKQSQ